MGHDHHHQLGNHQQSQRAIFGSFLLNFGFALIEFIFGALFNSSAVLADAVHDTGDALAIGLSWIFEKVSTRKSDDHYTLGYDRFSLLGAMITATILIVGSLVVVVENFPKLFHPEPVNANGMLWLGLVAIAVNLGAQHLLSRGSSEHESILSLHFLEDTLGWLAVILVSVCLHFTNWYILDPLLSLAISLFILSKALPRFIKNMTIFLEASPRDLDMLAIRRSINQLDEVEAVPQLNIWSIDGHRHVAMIHIILENRQDEKLVKDKIHHILEDYQVVQSAIECDDSSFEHHHHCPPSH
ncbi:cation diffusion facilitator family transporter [Streptococcus sobrinus]|uniref:Cation diffusion facilitator family transporter n=4 Tax=Streptococcus sobrinus TaxID=1310 RepID=U2JD01_9STRE|nr:cation diffusion facilitator family transporter [Streptococcus sobrinus]AWN62289.1 cation transporter [Streptococcus sobrinus]AWN64163.1 cation transporter [Streptococcus sobrinus]ERJ77655.1 cation diffusion facilitator family transporter [Streptococcus sobrinus W1703]SQG21341.1 cation efflux system protein [Streptococcus sobrinus]